MTASISFVTSGQNGDSGLPDIRDKDLVEREAPLKALIEEVLPDFAKACREKSDVVVVHQDSFALEYQADELLLLGQAIKFAGLPRNCESLAGTGKPLPPRQSRN